MAETTSLDPRTTSLLALLETMAPKDRALTSVNALELSNEAAVLLLQGPMAPYILQRLSEYIGAMHAETRAK
ncbi:MAG: hypothetical protein VKI63_02595 [Cyanobium sp.]|nr:hypothetical protein [Cyanobium sp.]